MREGERTEGRTDGQIDRQAADIPKLAVAFRSLANAPEYCSGVLSPLSVEKVARLVLV
jgi:hypothetical protein